MESACLNGINITKLIETNNEAYFLQYNHQDNYEQEYYDSLFQQAIDEKRIIGCSYNDDKWTLLKDDGNKYNIIFDIGIRPKINKSLKHFVLVELLLENFAVTSIQAKVNYIKKELLHTNYLDVDSINRFREDILAYKPNEKNSLLPFKEFVAYMPPDKSTEDYLNVLNSITIEYVKYSRDLPNYESIIIFDYFIKEFIRNNNITKKVKYYPILIWWIISSIIPLRPGEVYQLRKNDIYMKDGKYFIHIERIKHIRKQTKFDKTWVKDFELDEETYNLIYEYIEYVNEFDDSEYLFSIQNLEKTTGIKLRDDTMIERITYNQMRSIYGKFIREVIEGEYQYNVVPIGEKKTANDIERVRFGDVRHLAIINLMMMGVNPLTIMELAGHTNLDTQLNYCNHIETFMSSKAYMLNRVLTNREFYTDETYSNSQQFAIKKLMNEKYYDLPLVEGGKGRCHANGDVSKCMTLSCLFCPEFIADSNLKKEFFDELEKENNKEIETIKLEFKRIIKDNIVDTRVYSEYGKQYGIAINKGIMIKTYKLKKEE
jgi:integrase